MGQVAVSVAIAAPVEEVFALFTDLEQLPGRVQAIIRIEKLTPGPVGVGTRFRETRVMFGKEATEEMEFVAFEPNRSYTLRAASCGSEYTTVHRFQSEGGRTLVQLEFGWKAQTFMAKLFSPLAFLMKGMMRKLLQGDLEAIKVVAEAKR